MKRSTPILCGVAILLAAFAAITAMALETGRRRERVGEELMYFPSGHLLELSSLGDPQGLADLLWLRAIQYYGEHRMSDNRFPLAGHVFETITELDPYFAEAYIFGGLVLSDEGGDVERGLRLLRRGMAWNPWRWDLAFETGFVYYVAAKDDAQAARFFERARRLPGAPEFVTRFAAYVAGRAGDDRSALALWEEILQSARHPVMRDLAERKVRSLRVDLGLEPVEPGAPRQARESSAPGKAGESSAPGQSGEPSLPPPSEP